MWSGIELALVDALVRESLAGWQKPASWGTGAREAQY